MWNIFSSIIALSAGGICSVAGFSIAPHWSSSSQIKNSFARRFWLTASFDDEEEFARVPRRRQRGRFYDREDEEDAFYESVERKIYGDKEFDDDWEEDDDDFDEEDNGIFSNVLIDNPILDSIDPDGAAERFPELARDPRFWIDMILFIAFLNFLSAIGPQDYFPDLPYYV